MNQNNTPENSNFNQPVRSDSMTPLSQVHDPQNTVQAYEPRQINETPIRDSGQSNITSSSTVKSSKQFNPNSTQNYLQVAEIREGILIMKDGSFKVVISCKSINFDLMSGREREGVEYGYQGFLNSLYFPIQVLVRSNKVDIGPYLEKLIKIRTSQDNMLLNVLLDDYINYIEILAQDANIMDKEFFIVIPYYSTGESLEQAISSSGTSGLFTKKTSPKIKVNKKVYLKAKEEIQNRVDVVMSGLMQVGVQSQKLDTNQLSQLFYNFYNPDISTREPLVNFQNIASIYSDKKHSTFNPQKQGEL